jgi:hypothetical protein
VNHRRLSLLALSLSLTAGACVADQDPNAPASTMTPSELRARIDTLLPPVLDRSADLADAAGPSLYKIVRIAGNQDQVATSPAHHWVPLSQVTSAQAAWWFEHAILSDDTFDGRVYHLDPDVLCRGDNACFDALAANDYQILATAMRDDGLHISMLRGTDNQEVASLDLVDGGASFSVDLDAVMPLMRRALFPELVREGLNVMASGKLVGNIPAGDLGGFHVRAVDPIRVTIQTASSTQPELRSSLAVAGTLDGFRERGHGPVVVHSHLSSLEVNFPGVGVVSEHGLDAESSVTDSDATVTHFERLAQ